LWRATAPASANYL
jgi:uncharacterized membrane protein YtjA (UPF0391 family)